MFQRPSLPNFGYPPSARVVPDDGVPGVITPLIGEIIPTSCKTISSSCIGSALTLVGIALSIACYWTYDVSLSPWAAFYLYLFAIASMAIGLYVMSHDEDSQTLRYSTANIALGCASIFTLFFALERYPFALLGDSIRDGGWGTARLILGQLRDPFAWGRYTSHGLIIPALNIPFYHLFSSSSLTFRVPSTLLSVGTLYLTYRLAYKHFGPRTAWIATATLLANPFFLFFSRSEVVIAWSMFLSMLLLSCYLRIRNSKPDYSMPLLALIVGFSAGFHAGVRSFAVILFIIAIVEQLYFFRTSPKPRTRLVRIFGMSLAFFVLGFGPRVSTFSLDSFIKLDRSIFSQSLPSYTKIENQSCKLLCRYALTFKRIFLSPVSTASQSPIRENLIGAEPMQFGILVGLGSIIARIRAQKHRILLILLLTITLTNSAVTNLICADHRMAVLYSVLSLIVALGLNRTIELIERVKIPGALLTIKLFLVGFFIYTVTTFFTLRLADRTQSRESFLLLQALPEIRNFAKERNIKSLCLSASPNFQRFLKPLHVIEALKFYLPEISITISSQHNSRLIDSAIHVSESCIDKQSWTLLQPIVCGPAMGFYCKPEEYSVLTISSDSIIPTPPLFALDPSPTSSANALP